jgi:hypothetical protein
VKYDLKETGCEGVVWIQLRFRVPCGAVGNETTDSIKRRTISRQAESNC